MKKICIALLGVILLFSCVSCSEGEGNDPEQGYVFTVGNTTFGIYDLKDSVVGGLGEPRDIKRTGSCKTEEMDETYLYAGFDLYFEYSNGKGYFISKLELKDDTVKTPEGISIGSTRDAVIAAYGEGAEDSGEAIIYRKADMELTVFFSGDTVDLIRYSPASVK